MKYLCLAYGDEVGWTGLSEKERKDALAQDKVIQERGNLVSAVQPAMTAVRNWDNKLQVTEGIEETHGLPLAGFSIIEAANVEEVINLVADTPCARANGVIEIRQLWNTGS